MQQLLFNLSHTFISIFLVIAFGLAGHYWIGFALAVGFVFGREQAQAEYRWIETYGDGKRANLKWWYSFEPKIWDFHSWFWNLSLPILVMIVFKIIWNFL
jgi:hypothetical protein